MTITEIRRRFRELEGALENVPESGRAAAAQQRGRDFQALLVALVRSCDLVCEAAFQTTGEEIDGAFEYHGRHFLIEAKWWQDPMPAAAVYAFEGKLQRKLAGTLGIFVSPSGFTTGALEAIRFGRELRVILFDRADLEHLLVDGGFERVLQAKLWWAATRGELLWHYQSHLEAVEDDAL